MDKCELLNKKFKNCEPVFGAQMTVTDSTIMLEKCIEKIWTLCCSIWSTVYIIPKIGSSFASDTLIVEIFKELC